MVPPADVSTPSARLAQAMFDFPGPDYVILGKQERVGCIFAELARVRESLAVTRERFRPPQTGNPLHLADVFFWRSQ
jgi:hypothetical protein